MILSMALAVTGVTLHTMFQVNRGMHDQIAQAALLPRFSLQLRQDAHAAYAARIVDDRQTSSPWLSLSLPEDRDVRYEVDGPYIVRVVRRGTETQRHEVYPLAANRVGWHIDDDRRWLSLRIERNLGEIPGTQDATHIDLIETALGLHSNPSRQD